MWRIYTAIFVVLLAIFQYGVALVIINTMLESFSKDLEIDEDIGGAVIASILFLGAAIGGLIAGPFERAFKRYTQVVIGFLFAVGAFLCAFTTKDSFCREGTTDECVPYMAFVGRIISGIASGTSLVVSPKFMAEITPPEIRGSIGACQQFSIAMGVFLALLIGLPYEFENFDIGMKWWRIMFIFEAAVGVIQTLLSLLVLPVYDTKREEVKRSFKMASSKRITSIQRNPDENVAPDVKELEPDAEAQKTNEPKPSPPSFYRFFQRKYHRSILLGIGVPIACQVTGINLVSAYSTIIFKDAGLERPVVGTIIMGGIAIFSSACSIFFFDRLKRKSIAFWSFLGIALSHLGLALSNLAKESISGLLSLVFVISYTVFFTSGCGTLNTSYAPEVVPPEIAGFALGTGQCLGLLSSVLQVLIFPSVQEAIGTVLSFIILSAISFSCLLFMKIFMIETKGRELDDIVVEMTTCKRSRAGS